MSYWQQAKESLRHVLWIVGATTAGKSTIAKKLADDFGIVHYRRDTRHSEHFNRATEEEHPALYAFRTEPREAFWRRVMIQPPDAIRETMRDIFRELFRMVVEDLLAMPDDRAVVVDLFCGEALSELRQLIDRDRAVFLVPTEAFQKAEYQRRFQGRTGSKNLSGYRQALENCLDPEAIFMAGYVQFQLEQTRYVREECRKHCLPLLVTSGQSSLEESYKAVCDHFDLSGESQ